MRSMTIKEAKEIDLVDYLALLGYNPWKISGEDYWYLSPLPDRNEKTPSFKVDRRQNLWYDHGIGKGGSIIDFGMQFHRCNIPELLERLQVSFSFHREYFSARRQFINEIHGSGPPAPTDLPSEEKKIRVVSVHPITSSALLYYLGQRKIPVELAQAYCKEVQYELYGKQYYAIGFANDAGGYELRNPYFKGSSAPKGTTFFDNGAQQVAVFEGFFNFLSYIPLHQSLNLPTTNLLILNSLSFFEMSRPLMEKHGNINLYLDRDRAGMKHTDQEVTERSSYKDCSILYQGYKDLNQWLTQNFLQVQQGIQPKKRTEGLDNDPTGKQVAENRQKGHRL